MFRRSSSYLASLVSLTLIGTLIFVGAALSVSSVSANDSHVDDVSIIVPISCNLNSYNTTHSETVNPNTTEEDIGKTTLQAFCNDNDGFAIYAIGYTGNVDGTTTLVGNNTSLTIATSTNTSSSSSWSMKVTKETNTNTAYLPNNMTINNGYDSYSVVPTNWTKVATFSSATDTEEPNGKGAVLYTTYKVHIAPGQAADTYSGKVKYTLFHPSTSCLYYTIHFNPGDGSGYMADQPICNNGSTALSTNTFIPPSGYEFKEWNTAQDGSGTSYTNEQIINTNLADVGESITLYAMWERSLYSTIANLNKGTLAQNNVALADTITTPTSTNKNQDTSNSGVFTYDPSVYGTASDASNDYPIYFYRGILETNPGTYGSSGSANAYPNYVRLGNNTCWRIIRTTGSGGIKMIYNGIWSNNTCARELNGAQVSNNYFNSQGSSSSGNWFRNIAYVGYTFNNSVTDSTSATALSTIFGNDLNPSLNNTRSTIKKQIEDNWYTNNMTTYTNILEASAGYCSDRTVYDGSNTLQAESTAVEPFGGNSTYSFGALIRSSVTTRTPSFTCPRSIVDLYHYVANSNGVSNELKYPVALLTADESSFAGSGRYSAVGTSYSSQSFLCSGTEFWLLSPFDFGSGSGAVEANLDRMGSINGNNSVIGSYGVRPVISLIHSTTIASGSGTATDPWLIDE